MFSKFSVKKPYTVFVGIIVILVLGVVSFLKLTPDLLPSMDFPYIIITTTYVGASPEQVEETVTKPIEQSMARLDNINNISSTSAENFSMVMLEFAEGTDLGITSVDITNAIGQLESGWDDSVGTPIMLKINPDMLATAVVAVSMEDMDEYELTSFVENTLVKVFGKCGSRNKQIGIGRTYGCRKDSGHDYAGNDRRKKFSADYDKYIFRAGRGKESFFGGEQCSSDNSDCNCGRKRNYYPDGGNAAAHSDFGSFSCRHKAEKNLGHSEVTESPAES